MPSIELEVRVRPSKVAVPISRTAAAEQRDLAIRFSSRLWGGRYCPVFPAAPEGVDEAIRRWLERDLPDFVYGVGVADDVWRAARARAGRDEARCKGDYGRRGVADVCSNVGGEV